MIRIVGKIAAPVVFVLAMHAAVAQGPGGPGMGGQDPGGGQGPGGGRGAGGQGGQGGPGGGAQEISPLVPAGIVRTDVTTIRSLTMEPSMQAAKAALAACAVTDPHVAVVVVDTAGNPRLIMVGDGAKSSLVDHATRKGFTAASLRQVTSVEQKMVEANPTMTIPPQGQTLIEPGGVPIRAGTQVIGGIGVEGGDPMAAEKCAQAGVDSLNDVLHPEVQAPRQRQNAQPGGQPR